MMKSRVLATAALLCAGAISQANAAWDPVTAIDIHYGHDRDIAYTEFGGPIERLRFTADREDLFCRSIRVTFGNGTTREVFTGNLKARETSIVDLPGIEREVTRIDFNCSTAVQRGALILVAAELGSYRERWLTNAYWSHYWDPFPPDRIVSIGKETFSPPRDRETETAGAAGMSISAIAVQPSQNDAVCPVVRARFANGTSRDINVNWGEYLEQGRMYWFEVSHNDKDLLQVDMVCRPVGPPDVTLELFVASNRN